MSERDPGILARGPWPPEALTVAWTNEPFDAGPEANAQADTRLAALAERDSPTHDGQAARMRALSVTGDGLHMDCEPVRWSLRLTDDACDALASLCVVRDGDGRWLAGRRAAWVATWPGKWALGAGGAVEVDENPAETLPRELDEEWGLVPERLTLEAVLRLPSGLVMVVGQAHVATGVEVRMDPEHDEFAWWPADPDDWPEHADAPLRLMAGMLGG